MSRMHALVLSWRKTVAQGERREIPLDLTSYPSGPELRASVSFTESADFTEEGEKHRGTDELFQQLPAVTWQPRCGAVM